MTDEVVTRLYRALVEELRQRGHPEGQPLKVSELYQDLVPYRAVRSTLGVELNADYEHALLRLLSGERGLLRLEPAEAREELRREVEAPYPFVGLFRKFSASNVWVTMPERKQEPAPAAPELAPEPEPEAEPELEPEPESALESEGTEVAAAEPSEPAREPADTPRTAGGADVADAPGPRLAAHADRGHRAAAERAPVRIHHEEFRDDTAERMLHAGQPCAFCAEPLPSGRRVRFCPHCGGDQRLQPCPRCEAVLERDWRYCISCGSEVGTG